MSKFKRFFDERKLLVLWGIGAVAALSLVIASTVQPENAESPTEPSVSEEETQNVTEVQNVVIEFPAYLEDGKLEISKVFRFDGINPDCQDQDGKNIASVMVTNLSQEYLEKAEIVVKTAEGQVLPFCVTDLPAGKTAMLLATDNASVADSVDCVAVDCTAAWLDSADMIPEQIEVSVEDFVIILENTTDENIDEIVVYCHGLLDQEYFGGVTYKYTVKDLSADAVATVEAWNCFTGWAEVVRIDMD